MNRVATVLVLAMGICFLSGRLALAMEAGSPVSAKPGGVLLIFDDETLAAKALEVAETCAADDSRDVMALGLVDLGDPISLIRACDPLEAEGLGDAIGGTALSLTVDDADADGLIEALDDIEGIHAQPDFLYKLAGSPTDDPRSAEQYYLGPLGTGGGLSGANVVEAWSLARRMPRSSVTVAVLDTGADLGHEDLRGTVRTDLAYDAVHQSSVVTDADGHGTGVLGVIGSAANNGRGIAGVATGVDARDGSPVRLLPVDVFGGSDETTSSNVVKGLAYLDRLIESHKIEDLRVVNMSMEFHPTRNLGDDMAVHRLIRHLAEGHDVLCVCAGGNGVDGHALTSPCYPSDYDECLSVTSLSRSGANSTWSDYNRSKDVSAPGEHILTTCLRGYTTMSGTSFAAPIASGVAALMFSVAPDLDYERAIELIRATAAPLPDPVTNDRRNLTGSAGALDAKAALMAASHIASDGEQGFIGAGLSSDDVLRLCNDYTGEHHYTLDTHEAEALVRAGWTYEGVAWKSSALGEAVFRLFNPANGDHHYTMSTHERTMLVASGWRDEGVAWRSAAKGKDTVPVYRLYNRFVSGAGSHHYTTSLNEYATLPSTGWQQEGICWYGIT